jgi:hypothetical protein
MRASTAGDLIGAAVPSQAGHAARKARTANVDPMSLAAVHAAALTTDRTRFAAALDEDAATADSADPVVRVVPGAALITDRIPSAADRDADPMEAPAAIMVR